MSRQTVRIILVLSRSQAQGLRLTDRDHGREGAGEAAMKSGGSNAEVAADAYQVSDLQVDIRTRRVLRDGVDLGVTSLSFDLLLTLIHASPGLVTFDAIMERVWPGVVVSPETLTQRVKLLRQALDDSADHPRYILAVRGHGYRLLIAAVPLCAPALKSEPEPAAVRARPWWPFAALVVAVAAASLWWIFVHDRRIPTQSARVAPAAASTAYQYFLQAEAVVNGTPESFRAAIALYDEALALDPGFARALSGRAMNRAALVWIGSPLGRGLEDAQRDAQKALSLDSADARAHMVLASMSALRGEWAKSEESFLAARKASPQDAEILGRYAVTLLLPTGQLRKAAESATQAQRLAPANGFTSTILAIVDQARGADDEAVKYANLAESRGSDPRQLIPAHVSDAARRGRYIEAANYAIKLLPGAIRDAGSEEALRQAYMALADRAMQPAALVALGRLTSDPAWERVDARSRQSVLYLYAAFGAMDELYAEMNRLLRGNTYPQIIAVGSMWSPQMRAFRQDRRFQELTERLGLIDYWKQSGAPDGCRLVDSTLTCG